jgi:lycopene beta-cyclase
MFVDAVIAGGGLSGWSLAAHLADHGWVGRKVLIVDDPSAAATAAWGFWSTGSGLLDGAVSRSYGQVSVYAAGEWRRLDLGRYHYHVVRRPDLIRAAQRVVGGRDGFLIRPGRVSCIREGGEGAVVTVDDEPVRCRWAFDSVSGPPHDAPVDARLAFTGWEVRTDRPGFDPDVPTLFDFRTPQGSAARFVYVLPTANDRALVELTEFIPRSGRPSSDADRGAALAEYLTDVVGLHGYERLRTESAVLPLRTHAVPRGAGSVLTIGATAGLVKATTGYAYQRIQRDSAAIASSLVRCGHPFDLPATAARHRLLDAVLLDVLEHNPAELERAFADLFRTVPAETVLSFLDETAGVGTDLRIMAALRARPYLRALFRLAGLAGMSWWARSVRTTDLIERDRERRAG